METYTDTEIEIEMEDKDGHEAENDDGHVQISTTTHTYRSHVLNVGTTQLHFFPSSSIRTPTTTFFAVTWSTHSKGLMFF